MSYVTETAFGAVAGGYGWAGGVNYYANYTPDKYNEDYWTGGNGPEAQVAWLADAGFGKAGGGRSADYLELHAMDEIRGANRGETRDTRATSELIAAWNCGVDHLVHTQLRGLPPGKGSRPFSTCSGTDAWAGKEHDFRPLMFADMVQETHNGDLRHQVPFGGPEGSLSLAQGLIAPHTVLMPWVYSDSVSDSGPFIGFEQIMASLNELSVAGFDMLGGTWCALDNIRAWASIAASPGLLDGDGQLLGLVSTAWGDWTKESARPEKQGYNQVVAHQAWQAEWRVSAFWPSLGTGSPTLCGAGTSHAYGSGVLEHVYWPREGCAGQLQPGHDWESSWVSHDPDTHRQLEPRVGLRFYAASVTGTTPMVTVSYAYSTTDNTSDTASGTGGAPPVWTASESITLPPPQSPPVFDSYLVSFPITAWPADVDTAKVRFKVETDEYTLFDAPAVVESLPTIPFPDPDFSPEDLAQHEDNEMPECTVY